MRVRPMPTGTGLMYFRPEQAAPADDLAGDHEHAVAGIVQSPWLLWPARDMRFDYFEDEDVVAVNETIVFQHAFEIGVTLPDQRRLDVGGGLRRQPEFFELVDRGARAIANADDRVGQIHGRQVNDALPAAADEIEAVIAAGDHAADKRRHKFHDHVPAHGHYVALAAPGRGDEHDRAGLQIMPDVGPGSRSLLLPSPLICPLGLALTPRGIERIV